MRVLLLGVLVTCVTASPQYEKSFYSGVKGGNGGHGFQTGMSLVRGNNSLSIYRRYNSNTSTTSVNYEKGVCYIEVPTVNLVKDPAHVPAGNGSRSDLSRIRTCCQGYTKNIHNYRICDPVCTKDCVNALCTEPETCTCFPDHVKNLAGFCVPTCPIGCQNGQCAGGECICRDGYKLDSDSQFCIPFCRDNCGGIGNCTAPNTCECRSGYRSTPEGACIPQCDRCGKFADCTAPNVCLCQQGYEKNPQGDCEPRCENSCQPNGKCVAPNVCNYITTTTINSVSQRQPGAHNNPSNMETTRSPNYPRPQHAYPGYQQSNYPGYQEPRYPSHQQPNYPGYQQPQYPYPQQGQEHQLPNQPPHYPGNQASYFPVNQPNLNTNQQNITTGNQPSNYPGPNPINPNRQPIYYNPGQRPQNYPGSQQGYYGQQSPEYVDNQNPKSPNNDNEPYIPGNRYYAVNQNYPGNQHYYPQYPQQQGNYSNQNQSYPNPSYAFNQQTQNFHSDSQLGNVETLCAKPCINGVCVERDICTCNEGYVLDDTDISAFRCKPYCPGGCPNGVCSSPYFCICNLGYYKDHSVKGRTNCVKRIRRSADEPINTVEGLIFEIPDDEDLYN